MLGPVGGIAGSPFTAYDLMMEGHWQRAAEALSPKFVKDGLRAMRYADEGVLTRRGDPVVPADDLSVWELVWKGLGFSPDAVGIRYDANNAVKTYERRILERRKRLMAQYALAIMDGDRGAVQRARRDIAGFNRMQREIPITLDGLRRSLRSRRRYSQQAEYGMVVNRRLSHLREAGAFGG